MFLHPVAAEMNTSSKRKAIMRSTQHASRLTVAGLRFDDRLARGMNTKQATPAPNLRVAEELRMSND